jgi:hypothetical protein
MVILFSPMAVRLKPNGLRGASEVYLRVGVHVEPARDAAGSGISKGIQLLSYAEPAIPEGGISYGGPLQSALNTNGSRRDCGSLFLHAKPVTNSDQWNNRERQQQCERVSRANSGSSQKRLLSRGILRVQHSSQWVSSYRSDPSHKFNATPLGTS